MLADGIAAIIDGVRGNTFSLVREAAVDLSDQFSVVATNLHFKPS